MQAIPESLERVIKVMDIDPRHRHGIIFQLFDHLDPESSLQLVVDHDPNRCAISSKPGTVGFVTGVILSKAPTSGACA